MLDAHSPMQKRVKKGITILVLITVAVLGGTGWIDRPLRFCGLDRMRQANDRYLDNAFDGALAGFLILSGIKSGLAIVEGSSVGVGVDLQLGDVVQPAYDYVDMAWKAAMAGSTIIFLMQLSLESLTLIDHWALALFSCCLILYFLTVWMLPRRPAIGNAFKGASRVAATVVLMLYLILPLSVTGAAWLSLQITRPVMEKARAQFEVMEAVFTPENLYRRFFTEGQNAEGLSTFDLKERISDMGRGVKALMDLLKEHTELIAAATIRMIGAYLFDCIVFPLIFGLMLTSLIKGGVRYLFELNWLIR